MTLAQFARTDLEAYCDAQRLAANTVRRYRSILGRHILPCLGELELGAIGAREVQRLARRVRGCSDVHARDVLRLLGLCLGLALDLGLIDKAPKVRVPRLVEREVAPYNDEEFQAIREHASGLALVVVLLGADAGLRAGEIAALRWEDIDDTITVRASFDFANRELKTTKTGQVRRIPVSEALGEVLGAVHREGAYVVGGDGPAGYRALRALLKEAEEAAGLEVRGCLHRLRHTFASRLCEARVPLHQVAKLGGVEQPADAPPVRARV